MGGAPSGASHKSAVLCLDSGVSPAPQLAPTVPRLLRLLSLTQISPWSARLFIYHHLFSPPSDTSVAQLLAASVPL